jgi:hypothetical protein
LNPQGVQYDLDWGGVKEFCSEHGLRHVPEVGAIDLLEDDFFELEPGILDLLDMRLYEEFDQTMVRLEDDNPCDEGVVIRVEGLNPTFYKAKSPRFLEHESKVLDEGVPDMEEVG